MAYSLGLGFIHSQEFVFSKLENQLVMEISQEDSFSAIIDKMAQGELHVSNNSSFNTEVVSLDLCFLDERIIAKSDLSQPIVNAEEFNVIYGFSLEDSFLGTIEKIREEQQFNWCYQSSIPESLSIDLCFLDKIIVAKPGKQPKDQPRNYFAQLSQKEKDDIRFILTTLANNSVVKIATYRSSLKKAGDRVDHIHPFRFLQCIFTNEDLKVCIRNIQGKSWVWGEFLEGITSSLREETQKNNLRPEYLVDFATILGIDVDAVYQSYLNNQWEEMVNILINIVPRTGITDRYDI